MGRRVSASIGLAIAEIPYVSTAKVGCIEKLDTSWRTIGSWVGIKVRNGIGLNYNLLAGTCRATRVGVLGSEVNGVGAWRVIGYAWVFCVALASAAEVPAPGIGACSGVVLKSNGLSKLAPCEEVFVKESVSGTVQPSPLAVKPTLGNGFTVIYAGLISASATPLALVATSVMVKVPAVLKA